MMTMTTTTTTTMTPKSSSSAAFGDVVAQLARNGANQARFAAMHKWAVDARRVLLLHAAPEPEPSGASTRPICALFAYGNSNTANNNNNNNGGGGGAAPSFAVFAVAPTQSLCPLASISAAQAALSSSMFQSMHNVCDHKILCFSVLRCSQNETFC
jgi:hypothetical protein